MKFIKIYLFLVLFISVVFAAQAPLQPLNALQGQLLNIRIKNIRQSYNNLRLFHDENDITHFNLDKIKLYLDKINYFLLSTHQAQDPFTYLDQNQYQKLLNTLNSARTNIRNFIDQHNNTYKSYFDSLFEETLESLGKRYRLAKIEEKIINEQGWMHDDVLDNLPIRHEKTIRLLTGRIFVVKGNTVISTSSGMIIPRIDQNGLRHFDQIITCGHSMKPEKTDIDLEYYFVRTEALNLKTGIFNPTDIENVVHVGGNLNNTIDTRHFVQYLRNQSVPANSNNVRRIISFEAYSQPPHQQAILEHHSPRYQPSQDNGIGYLQNNGFTFAHNLNLSLVNILNNLPPMVAAPYEYYAIGYPIFRHFDTIGESRLIKQRRFAPLTMTRSTSADLQIVNGKLQHGASSMKGMSGGPILRFNNNTIEILGIVQSGIMDDNFGAKFW